MFLIKGSVLHDKNECTLFLLVLFVEKEKFSCEVTLSLLLLAVRVVSYSHSLGVVVVRISHTYTYRNALCSKSPRGLHRRDILWPSALPSPCLLFEAWSTPFTLGRSETSELSSSCCLLSPLKAHYLQLSCQWHWKSITISHSLSFSSASFVS